MNIKSFLVIMTLMIACKSSTQKQAEKDYSAIKNQVDKTMADSKTTETPAETISIPSGKMFAYTVLRNGQSFMNVSGSKGEVFKNTGDKDFSIALYENNAKITSIKVIGTESGDYTITQVPMDKGEASFIVQPPSSSDVKSILMSENGKLHLTVNNNKYSGSLTASCAVNGDKFTMNGSFDNIPLSINNK